LPPRACPFFGQFQVSTDVSGGQDARLTASKMLALPYQLFQNHVSNNGKKQAVGQNFSRRQNSFRICAVSHFPRIVGYGIVDYFGDNRTVGRVGTDFLKIRQDFINNMVVSRQAFFARQIH